VAERPATGETLSIVLAPRHPVAPGTTKYTALTREQLGEGAALADLATKWRAFLRDTDIVSTWGHYPWSLFEMLGLGGPHPRLDLRQAARDFARGKVG